MSKISKTLMVSKHAVPLLGNAWKLVKSQYPTATIARYTKDYRYDTQGMLLVHDWNYYFEVADEKENL